MAWLFRSQRQSKITSGTDQRDNWACYGWKVKPQCVYHLIYMLYYGVSKIGIPQEAYQPLFGTERLLPNEGQVHIFF